MDFASCANAAAWSWCLVTLHREGQIPQCLFGDSRAILGLDPGELSDATIATRLMGEPSGPHPWQTPCEARFYLATAVPAGAQWLELGSVTAPQGGVLMSTRVVRPGTPEELLVLARLSLGGSLLGPMSHELNNVVQGLASAEYLFRDCLENGDAVEMEDVDQLAGVVENLKSMAAQVQRFARVGVAPAEPVQLLPLVAGATGLLTSIGRLGLVEVEIDVPEDLPDLHWRLAELDFVLVALLANAVDASLGGPDAPWLRLRARVADNAIAVEIHNSGARLDFPGASVPRMTSKDRNRHAGLGLSVAREIVVRCGGSMEAAAGQGSGLRLSLPLQATEAAA